MTNHSQKKFDDLSDQRYFPRWEVENRVLYQLEDQMDTLEAQTIDLSCAGACLTVPKTIRPQQTIKLVIYLSPNKFINVNGKIIWTKSVGGEQQIGIQFENISLKNQDIILQHAFEVRHDQVTRNWFKGWER